MGVSERINTILNRNGTEFLEIKNLISLGIWGCSAIIQCVWNMYLLYWAAPKSSIKDGGKKKNYRW